MKKNTVTLLSLSAIFGLGAVYVANNWLMQSTAPELKVDELQVAVISAPVTTGTIIDAKHFTMQAWPRDLVPDTAVFNREAIMGKVATEALYPGDIVRMERLADKGEGSALASLIEENMRAITIRVDDVVGVAGFLLPGNRVDILNTFKTNNKTQTEIVLSNVRVLAIDQSAENNESKPKVVRAVTVEVSLNQAEALMNARSRGTVQLALRNPIDKSAPAPVEVAKLPEPIAAPAKVAAPAPVVRVVNAKVDVIRGTEQESVQIKL